MSYVTFNHTYMWQWLAEQRRTAVLGNGNWENSVEGCSQLGQLQVPGVEELSAKTSQLFCSGNLQMKAASHICTSEA